jgi:hypothetical protein
VISLARTMTTLQPAADFRFDGTVILDKYHFFLYFLTMAMYPVCSHLILRLIQCDR